MVNGQELRQIDFIINIVASIFGIFANVLLIFLLSTTRVPELKNCSRIIFQIAIIDIISAIIMVTVMPIAIVIDGHEFFLQNGPLKTIAQPWNHMLILLWLFFHLFSLSVVPVQFVFRYLLLCKNKTITNKLYASLFFIPFLISLIHICIAYFKSYPNMNYSSKIAKELAQYFDTNGTDKMFIISSGGEHPFSDLITVNVSATILTSACYFVIFYYGLKINAFLKASSDCFTPKTAQMHQSLNKVLFFQALTPIIFLITPTFVILIFSFTKQSTTPELTIFLTVIAWSPFVNAAFALITLKPLQRKFLRYFKKDVDSSSISNIPKISTINGQIVRQINSTVNIVAGILGISVNILLIFLLLSTRIPELKHCNRLILQIATVDIIDSLVMITIMPPLRRKLIGYFKSITDSFKSVSSSESSASNFQQSNQPPNMQPFVLLPRRHSCIGPN